MKTKKRTLTSNPQLITSLSIVIGTLLICITMLGLSGGFQNSFRSLKKILPKFAKYQKIKDITDYTNISQIFGSQPRLSYNRNSKYVFAEVSDLDCINCANFHGYNSSQKPTYQKILDDYVALGKMDYVWLDNQNLGQINKHSSMYCVAEQDTKKFFEYKEILYKNYGKALDINTAKDYIKPLKLDEVKFEECFNSNKYNTRVSSISTFARSQSASGTPTFLIYELEEVKIKVNDKDEIQKQPKLIAIIVGNQSYDFIKSELQNYIK